MAEISVPQLQDYLQSLLQGPVKIVAVTPLCEPADRKSAKGYGYGVPLLVRYDVHGHGRQAVLETVRPGPFGHEHMADRAHGLLWAHRAYGLLPRHARSLDVGGVCHDGHLQSLGAVDEVFLLMEHIEGREYAHDLARLEDTPALRELDLGRADALCDYLVEIHRLKRDEPGLYVRRIRDLLGHGEGIMGIVDSYPTGDQAAPPDLLEEIERRCLRWRWRIKHRTDRLSQVHGDFHPWNILFRAGTDFSVLDRSRGEWGEPADDVCSLTSNYLFLSLRHHGQLDGEYAALFGRFWDRYVAQSGDHEVLHLAAPFLAFRGLVMASPVWYPRLGKLVRARLLSFALNVLDSDVFDPRLVNTYCEA